jgi:hypothetical protein
MSSVMVSLMLMVCDPWLIRIVGRFESKKF